MKEDILSISCDLKEGSMSLNEAKIQLTRLLHDIVNIKRVTATIVDKYGFTPTNKCHIILEVLGEEKYIINNLNIGDELELLHYR